MTLLRAIPRTMLASYFVVAGVRALRDPEALVPAAEPLVDRVVPVVKQYSPEQVAGYVPENAVTLVRINGIAQVVGGAALATGKGRRLGALLLAGSLVAGLVSRFLPQKRGVSMLAMELPLYRRPQLKSILKMTWARASDYLKRAGAPIAVVAACLWLLSNFGFGAKQPAPAGAAPAPDTAAGRAGHRRKPALIRLRLRPGADRHSSRAVESARSTQKSIQWKHIS